jgi:NADPH:quinone reductase-like Zn-dependent oxidoreductase
MREIPTPVPGSDEALIRVHATSLNAGEVRRAAGAAAGQGVGWDIAGTVETAAADGSSPPAGTRVVAFAEGTGWADFAVVEGRQIGVVAESVSFEDAATLPVAGLTALRALGRNGNVLGRRVLIVPGTGGVGLFAIQLGHFAGAHVTAVIRDPGDAQLLQTIGANDVIVGSAADAKQRPRFDVILESLGGDSLAAAVGCVAADGVVVTFGQTISGQSTINVAQLYATGGASIYGFYLFHEARRRPVARDLERLCELVATGRLRTHVDVRYDAAQIEEAIAALRERRVTGKVVVRFA